MVTNSWNKMFMAPRHCRHQQAVSTWSAGKQVQPKGHQLAVMKLKQSQLGSFARRPRLIMTFASAATHESNSYMSKCWRIMLRLYVQQQQQQQQQDAHLGRSIFCVEHGHHQRGNANTKAQKHAANHQHGNVDSPCHDGSTSHKENARDQERDLQRWVWVRLAERSGEC